MGRKSHLTTLHRFIVLIALSFIVGCTNIVKQTPFNITAGLKSGAPEGTPIFRNGWKAGCESGIAAYGGLHHKLTNHYNYSPNALLNNEYQLAWELGFRHCRWYTSSWLS